MNVLKGKRVLVTRPNHQSDSFVKELSAVGALPVIAPAIKVYSRMDELSAQASLDRLDTFDWIVFTSANGVDFFIAALEARGELKKLKKFKIAAIGPKTSAALEKKVKKADAIPARYISDAIAGSMGDVKGAKILLARAAQASEVLGKELVEKGAVIEELEVYDIEQNLDDRMIEGLRNIAKPDYLTFTSSSTVRSMKQILKIAERDWLETVPSVCIGPVTARTLSDFGIEPYAVASVYTIEGMIQAIEQKAAN